MARGTPWTQSPGENKMEKILVPQSTGAARRRKRPVGAELITFFITVAPVEFFNGRAVYGSLGPTSPGCRRHWPLEYVRLSERGALTRVSRPHVAPYQHSFASRTRYASESRSPRRRLSSATRFGCTACAGSRQCETISRRAWSYIHLGHRVWGMQTGPATRDWVGHQGTESKVPSPVSPTFITG